MEEVETCPICQRVVDPLFHICVDISDDEHQDRPLTQEELDEILDRAEKNSQRYQ